MKLNVYKGFDKSFLNQLRERPLLDCDIELKQNVLKYSKAFRKQLGIALLSLDENDECWLTYEEYSVIKSGIDDAVKEDGLKLKIYKNNLYPDYYPVPFEVSSDLLDEITLASNGDKHDELSDDAQSFFAIYNFILSIDGKLYGSFYNYEYDDQNNAIDIENYYPYNAVIMDSQEKSQYNIFLNDDVETYLKDLERIKNTSPQIIGVKSSEGYVSKRIITSLKAYSVKNDIKLIKYHEILEEDKKQEEELISIARDDIGINNFTGFRKIKFYKNPDINNEIVDISQGQIIREIINQAENAYDDDNGNTYRDIFITASTGAGKSVMFQIPAVYLAKKHKKLTIVIEPVKALMQDQKEKLISNGFNRVEAFNSDLITQVEKEAVLKRVKEGEVDLLYLSPETLLSYSIETIIGDREIGLLIVDEAHIVTTWGVGFRPDYWYLGGYINRLRSQTYFNKKNKKKIYHFPVCAFTATAINGGIDDSISETIISLYMENPIKYLGYVRRDDIEFNITHQGENTKLPKAEYNPLKVKALNKRIDKWLANGEKTIVYFPYAKFAYDASKGMRDFAGIRIDKRIGIFTGRNVNELSLEAFKDLKKQTFDGFRLGTTPVMYATKAFGMGVDVDDVNNVYHYAVTGNLCDYVQEIGRAARKPGMTGYAITDNFFNDISYMKALFGMSQIKQYQIRQVLHGIYDTFRNKQESRNFLISPQSFTYIFNGKGAKDEDACINKLKTCLLMLEKDFYDKFNFKVLISRPQSVFTKAFVCVDRLCEDKVLASKYGKSFKFVKRGRFNEIQPDGSRLSDYGDIYSLDLKTIWEEYYPNISFPTFKYWYFNSSSQSKEKVEIMPEIRSNIAPRQCVNIEARGELLLSELRERILDDFDYVTERLYSSIGKNYFTLDDFAKVIKDRFGITTARIIANSLFDLVDPDNRCVKKRVNDSTGQMVYTVAFGNFKEYLRKPLLKSSLIGKITYSSDGPSFSDYIDMSNNENSTIALKLLSIFNYITYEIVGGEEPEIFIRLNDPDKIKNIVLGNCYYSNDYVNKAKQKHERDVEVLLRFFNNLETNEERWNYIENYFLGYDVLEGHSRQDVSPVKLSRAIDKEHSYPLNMVKSWAELMSYFDENDHIIIEKLKSAELPIPEYLGTAIKKNEMGNDILMSWPSSDTLICQQDTSDISMEYFRKKGWHAYRIYEIDYKKIKEELNNG